MPEVKTDPFTGPDRKPRANSRPYVGAYFESFTPIVDDRPVDYVKPMFEAPSEKEDTDEFEVKPVQVTDDVPTLADKAIPPATAPEEEHWYEKILPKRKK